KTPDGQTINAGDTATFTIVVSNTGTGAAKGVTLNDALPVGDGIAWTTATAGCTVSGLNLSCTLGDIAAGGSTTVVVSGKTSYAACTWMPNPAAIASATNAPSAQNDGVITCVRPALHVVKTPDGQTINAGDTATFTIVVSNTGQGIARSVTLADSLPVGDGISWATATAGCTTSGLNLSCTFG